MNDLCIFWTYFTSSTRTKCSDYWIRRIQIRMLMLMTAYLGISNMEVEPSASLEHSVSQNFQVFSSSPYSMKKKPRPTISLRTNLPDQPNGHCQIFQILVCILFGLWNCLAILLGGVMCFGEWLVFCVKQHHIVSLITLDLSACSVRNTPNRHRLCGNGRWSSILLHVHRSCSGDFRENWGEAKNHERYVQLLLFVCLQLVSTFLFVFILLLSFLELSSCNILCVSRQILIFQSNLVHKITFILSHLLAQSIYHPGCM